MRHPRLLELENVPGNPTSATSMVTGIGSKLGGGGIEVLSGNENGFYFDILLNDHVISIDGSLTWQYGQFCVL